jgi:hypothetical protein
MLAITTVAEKENMGKKKADSALEKRKIEKHWTWRNETNSAHVQKPEALSQLHSLKIPETRLILILFGFISSFCCC